MCLLVIVVQDLPARSDMVPIGYPKRGRPSEDSVARVGVSKKVCQDCTVVSIQAALTWGASGDSDDGILVLFFPWGFLCLAQQARILQMTFLPYTS